MEIETRNRKKQLTKNRLLNSIDTALDLENYDRFPLPEAELSIQGEIKEGKNSRKINFSNHPSNMRNSGRQSSHNIVSGKPGVKNLGKSAKTELDHLKLFLTDDMLTEVITNTNCRINEFIKNLPDNFNENVLYPFIKTIDIDEFIAFLGLCYYRALWQQNKICIKRLYGDSGPSIFGATMSRNRFGFLMKHLTFDDATTRQERWRKDRFAAFRHFFESFNRQCRQVLIPDDYLSLDETLYPMRTQVAFKQFNPSKPAKYGMLFKSINGARYPYTFASAPYCGKPVDEDGEFYMKGTEPIVHNLVQQMERTNKLTGRNISFDRLYTSISLAEWLLERKKTCVGPLQHNRKGIPPVLKEVKHRELLSSEIYWEKEKNIMSLSSYVVQTSKCKKNVIILSTHSPILGTTKDDDKKKPGIYKLYDFTKGGTDIIDQRMGFYSTKTKSRRWTITAFSYVLDMARVNSSTVFAMNNSVDPTKQDSFSYLEKLVRQMVEPHIRKRIRKRSRNGLGWFVIQKMQLYLMDKTFGIEERTAPLNQKGERCHVRGKGTYGNGQKCAKNKLCRVKNTLQSLQTRCL